MGDTATLLTDCWSTDDIFDSTHTTIVDGDVHAAMGQLRRSLHELRSHLQADDWRLLGREAREHPLHEVLLESPFTRRAYDKPRGYAGDAVLMDLIYGMTAPHGQLSALGGMLYGYEFDSPCFQSVRARRAILAREIDQVAALAPGGRVLSVASGHLREIEWSRAARAGGIARRTGARIRAGAACARRAAARFVATSCGAGCGRAARTAGCRSACTRAADRSHARLGVDRRARARRRSGALGGDARDSPFFEHIERVVAAHAKAGDLGALAEVFL